MIQELQLLVRLPGIWPRGDMVGLHGTGLVELISRVAKNRTERGVLRVPPILRVPIER
jgi:hypothetical protein